MNKSSSHWKECTIGICSVFSLPIHSVHPFIPLSRCMFNLSYRHITVSTVGVVSKMRLFTDDFPLANLALSLHAPSQSVRKQIVPTSSAFTVKKIMGAVVNHIECTNNKVFIEYIMIGNVNAEEEHARALSELMVTHKVTPKVAINLIPYNPTELFVCSSICIIPCSQTV